MLPASAVRRPSARRKCAISALTVLLPFVPVTAITRASGCSANQSARARREQRAVVLRLEDLGPIRADAGRLDDDVERAERRGVGRRRDRSSRPSLSRLRATLRPRIRSRCRGQKRPSLRHRCRKRSIAAPASAREALRARPCPRARSPRPRRAGRRAQRCASISAARRAGMRCSPCGDEQRREREALRIERGQDLVGEARDDRVLAPFRARRKRCHRRARFDRLRRRIRTACGRDIPSARRTPARARMSSSRLRAEDREQSRLGHERREREEHEMAFRTLAAPAIGGPRRRGCGSCGCSWRTRRRSAPCARSARRPQAPTTAAAARSSPDRPRHATFSRRVEAALEFPALAPLVIDRLAVVFERRARRRALVRERDRVEAVEHRRDREDRRVDRGHRNVAVPRALPVVLEQHRRELAADVQASASRCARRTRRSAASCRSRPRSRARSRISAARR